MEEKEIKTGEPRQEPHINNQKEPTEDHLADLKEPPTIKEAFTETMEVLNKNVKIVANHTNVKKARKTLGSWINNVGDIIKGKE